MSIKFARRMDVGSACVDIRHYPKTDVVVNGWSVKFSKAEETTEQVRTSALVIILLPTL